MKLPPYPKYKPSDVEWLGEVPAHWELRRLKTLCSRSALYGANMSATTYTATGVRFLRTTDITENGRLRAGGVFLPEASVRDYLLADGDVLISRSGTIGRSFLYDPRVHSPCAYAGYLVRFVPASKVLSRYIFLFTKTLSFAGFLQAMAISSTIDNVNGEKFACCLLSVPPLPEQAAIVRFLDRETEKIDELVVKKRTLIRRLKEKRAALISHTLTRGLPLDASRQAGLDPNSKLRPSGIDCLGKVPEHWEILPFTKYVADRSDYRGRTPEKTETGIFLVTAKNVRMGHIDYDNSKEYVAQADYAEIMRRGLPKMGDILFTTEAPLGNVALVNREDIALAQRIIRFRMNPRFFDSSFILYELMSDHFQAQLQRLSTGSTAKGLKASKLPILRVVAPPLNEQSLIARFLDSETRRIDFMVAKIETAIERLREYRAALITAAVTGKIDVREAAA